MRFASPFLLVLVALVPVAGFFWAFLRARREKALANITLTVPPSGASGLQLSAVTLGLALVLVAAARPQWGRSTQQIVARSRNVVVAVDISWSMTANDVHPNRLERVKSDVANLIDSLGSDRCALVAFCRTGFALSPLTTDRAFLRSALESLEPEPHSGTDLGSAIRECLRVLDPAADDHNAIILISDGGDLRGEALAGAELAKKRGVPIFTVGIGDPVNGATMPAEDGKGVKKFEGKPVQVKLEAAALKAIAEASGGHYVPLATLSTAETTLGAIYRKFLRQVAAAEQNEEDSRLGERYQLFLLPGLVLLLFGASLSRGRFARRTSSNPLPPEPQTPGV